MKKSIFLLFFLLFSNHVLGLSDKNVKTFLFLKIYFEPHFQHEKLAYMLRFPKTTYYSFYLGSDLPQWQFGNNKIIRGQFFPVELVNIRVHSLQKDAQDNTAELMIIDTKNRHVIWQGELYYGDKNKKIIALPKINNKKYYDTAVNLQQANKTVWIEMTDR